MKKSIILLLFSLFITAITYAQETSAIWTDLAFSQTVVRVRGSEDEQMIEQQVKLFLNQLDVQENLLITVIFSSKMPDNLKGITISDSSPEPDKYQIIRVVIDAKLSRAKQLLVLAHEMIHVKQYAKKELITLDDRRVEWKGKEFFVYPGPNRHMPWEGEAHHADLPLVRQFKSAQNQMQEMLAEHAPNPAVNKFSSCSYLAGNCKSSK